MIEESDYSEFVQKLFAKRHEGMDGLMHAAVGISGEAGEILDAVKKTWVYGKSVDVTNIIEELGDLEFYMQALRNLIYTSRDEILLRNMDKLAKRYPDGYSDTAAIERADKRLNDAVMDRIDQVFGGEYPKDVL